MPDSRFLTGYRIIDLSQYIPGPFATRLLADHGAEVIKIEPPHGDPMRHFLKPEGDTPSPLYRHLNRGKKIVRLDLKTDAGKALFTRLLASADVLLESFRPGVMARLGFGRETLQEINPKLIHCALSGFGQTGPYRERGGHDLTYCAVSGALSASGTVERPVMTFPPLADHAGALQASNDILAALLARERTGRGAWLDISLCESALSWTYLTLLPGNPENSTLREQLLINGGAACYHIYQTADHHFVALAAIEEKFWSAFCNGVGHPEWVSRQHEALPQQGLIEELECLFAGADQRHWQQLLQDVDCCFEPIPDTDEVINHPQHQAREALNGMGPRHPCHADGKPLAHADDYIELEPQQLSNLLD